MFALIMFKFKNKESDTVRYTRLEDQSVEGEKRSHTFCGFSELYHESRALPWMLSTLIFALLSAYLLFTQEVRNMSGTFETGFHTDLGR